MSGLLGTLTLGANALQTQSRGLAVAGQNLANVNNPAYTRQRLLVQAEGDSSGLLEAGNGVSAIAIQRIHDKVIDRQLLDEASTTASWTARQSILETTQDALGEVLGGSAGAEGSGMARDLDGLFSEFQNLAAAPTSLSQRAVLVSRAQTLASDLNQADARLDSIEGDLQASITEGVRDANELLGSITQLSQRITRAEIDGTGTANDLRDLRQQKLEALAGLVDIESAEDADGSLTLRVGGQPVLSGNTLGASLVVVDTGGGRLGVATTAGDPVTLSGGAIHGLMTVRDGAVADLRTGLDTLAASLISEVNGLHQGGFDLQGGTGGDFFAGTTAGTIRVHPDIVDDASRIQAAGTVGAPGDNQVARALAALAQKPVAGLGGQTFTGSYARTVANLGQELATAGTEVKDQGLLQQALQARRAAVSGVSIDEELADLVKYQKAFQASARIVAIVDGMLDEVINMIR